MVCTKVTAIVISKFFLFSLLQVFSVWKLHQVLLVIYFDCFIVHNRGKHSLIPKRMRQIFIPLSHNKIRLCWKDTISCKFKKVHAQNMYNNLQCHLICQKTYSKPTFTGKWRSERHAWMCLARDFKLSWESLVNTTQKCEKYLTITYPRWLSFSEN